MAANILCFIDNKTEVTVFTRNDCQPHGVDLMSLGPLEQTDSLSFDTQVTAAMVRNAAKRFNYGVKWWEHISPVLNELQCSPVKHSIEMKVLVSVIQAFAGTTPPCRSFNTLQTKWAHKLVIQSESCYLFLRAEFSCAQQHRKGAIFMEEESSPEETGGEMYKRKGKIKISQMTDEYKEDQQFSDEKNSTFDRGIEERSRVIVEQELQVDDEDRRLSAHSTSETANQMLTAAIQESDGDLEDDCDIHDGELQPTSLSKKLVKRRKAQKRHADNGDDRGLLNLSVEEKHGKGQNSTTTLKEDSDGDEYGAKPFGISSTSPVQRKKMKTKHGVAAADPAQCGSYKLICLNSGSLKQKST
nr:uncharacterized protein LOC129161162 [Nothobranchius furzeri]